MVSVDPKSRVSTSTNMEHPIKNKKSNAAIDLINLCIFNHPLSKIHLFTAKKQHSFPIIALAY
jgi:hypothetical protein